MVCRTFGFRSGGVFRRLLGLGTRSVGLPRGRILAGFVWATFGFGFMVLVVRRLVFDLEFLAMPPLVIGWRALNLNFLAVFSAVLALPIDVAGLILAMLIVVAVFVGLMVFFVREVFSLSCANLFPLFPVFVLLALPRFLLVLVIRHLCVVSAVRFR